VKGNGNVTDPKRRLVRTKVAAEYLSVSEWSLRNLVANGELPVVQTSTGSPFLFDLRDLDGWIERNKKLTPA